MSGGFSAAQVQLVVNLTSPIQGNLKIESFWMGTFINVVTKSEGGGGGGKGGDFYDAFCVEIFTVLSMCFNHALTLHVCYCFSSVC